MRARARHASNPTPVDPVVATGGAVTSWLQNNTVGLVSSVPDSLVPGSPAVQATAARQPTGNADGSISYDGARCLAWPLHSGNNSNTMLGFAFWFSHTNPGGTRMLLCLGNEGVGGATQKKIHIFVNTSLRVAVEIFDPAYGNYEGRRYVQNSGLLVTNQPYFFTLEYDSAQAIESTRVVMTLNGSVLGYSSVADISTPTGAFSGLRACNGNAIHGAQNDDTTLYFPLIGKRGKSTFALTAKQAGTTIGLMTTAGRNALMSVDAMS